VTKVNYINSELYLVRARSSIGVVCRYRFSE